MRAPVLPSLDDIYCIQFESGVCNTVPAHPRMHQDPLCPFLLNYTVLDRHTLQMSRYRDGWTDITDKQYRDGRMDISDEQKNKMGRQIFHMSRHRDGQTDIPDEQIRRWTDRRSDKQIPRWTDRHFRWADTAVNRQTFLMSRYLPYPPLFITINFFPLPSFAFWRQFYYGLWALFGGWEKNKDQ